jgi:hypothetical protein
LQCKKTTNGFLESDDLFAGEKSDPFVYKNKNKKQNNLFRILNLTIIYESI